MTRSPLGAFAMSANGQSTARRTALFASFALIAALLALVPATPAEAFAKEVTDVNPDVSDNGNANAATGGRVNGLASVPGDNQMFYAASEWGGLFKTTDGGDEWVRLDAHKPMAMWEVEVDPGNTGTVYATSFYDGRIASEAGINVSYDGGATWTHPASANPAPGDSCTGGVNDEPSAFGISIDPGATNNVAIGTNCGVALSSDSGANWTFTDPDPGADPSGGSENVWDVVIRGNTIDICGDDGYYRSPNGGSTYTPATTQPPAGLCEIDISPDDGNDLFAAAPATVGGTSIWETNDGNVTWIDHGDPETATQGGRIHFLRVNDRPGTAFDVWFGEFSLWRAGCDSANTPSCPNAPYPGGFTQNVNSPGQAHDDAGDIVFNTAQAGNACPAIFSSDGGVHQNTDQNQATCQNPTFQRANVGMHALWLWGFSGADDPGDDEFLYGGAQDTGSFGTSNADDDPPTWTNPNCCDVFDFISDPNRALFTFCCAGGVGPRTTLNQGTPGLAGQSGVTIPPSGLLPEFRPTDIFDQFGDDDYVILTRDCTFPAPATGSSRGCPATNDGGVFVTTAFSGAPTWTELGNATEPNSAAFCGIQAAVSAGTPTFYLQVGGGTGGNCDSRGGDQLWKYSGIAPGGTWQRVDNNPGIQGTIGIFAVDPNNPNRLYASDVGGAGGTRMVFSTDGGQNWNPDPELDNMMTGGGVFKMDTAIGPTNFEGFNGYPQPTLLAFDPDDPNLIAAGGHDSGVFLSTNGGDTWVLMTDPFTSDTSGIDHLPQPRFAYFDHETDSVEVYVGTQGRGFWRLTPAIADLRVTKTDHPDPAIAGDLLLYDITVFNDGSDDAPNVIVTDDLPEEVDYLTDTDNCTEDPVGSGNLTCPIGDLASGESYTFTIEVQVHADVVSENGGPKTIVNRASASSDGAVDPNSDDNAAVEPTIINDSADLEITKVCEADTTPVAGDNIDCTLFIDNHGPSFAREVVVDDVIDSSQPFTVTDIMPSQGTCSPPAPPVGTHQEFTCELGELEPATSSTTGRATITYTITGNEGQEITNVATVRSDTPDPNPGNNRAERSITLESSADLRILKTDDPDPVVAGEGLTYTIVATNDGPSIANDVRIEDLVPAGVSIDSVNGSGGPATCNAGVPGDPFRPTTCAFGDVPPGPAQARTMTIEVTVLPDTRGQLNNDARVTSSTFDPSNQNNFDTESTTVDTRADLVLTKSDSPDPVVAGTPLDYTMTVLNNGPSTAMDVTILDDLPQEVTFKSTTISNGTGTCDLVVNNPNNLVLCELNDLDPGEHVTVVLHTIVKSGTLDGTIVNIADATSDEGDDTPGDAHQSIDTEVQTVADLLVVKTSNQDTYKPSDTIQYTITVSDRGPSDAQQVVVVDTLPPKKVGYYVFDTQNCGLSGTTLTCALGAIVAGQEKSFNVYFRVQGNKGVIENRAEVSSTTFDPVLSDNVSVRKTLIAGGGKGGGGGGQG